MGRPKGSKNKSTLAKEASERRKQRNQIPTAAPAEDDYDDMAYLANPRLKKCGAQITFTEEQIKELAKCAEDPEYFIEHYVKVISVMLDTPEPTTVELFPFQKNVVKTYHENRFTIFMCPRQSGKTMTTTGYLLHYVLFNTYRNVGVLAQKEVTAIEILTRIKTAFEWLPLWMQQGIVEWNKKSIVLENGCRILCESTSSGAIRGFALHLLYLDEFAHVPANIAEDFFTSVWPTISAGNTTKMIITSTPNGLNLFYKFWSDAEKETKQPKDWNGFKALRAYYTDVPGHDEEWARQQRRALGERKYNQEVLCEFLGSNYTLINAKKLRELVFKEPNKLWFDDMLKIYEDPIPGHSYVLSADSSEGRELDYHCFTIFDVSDDVWRVVAKFRDNAIDELMFASYIHQGALHYNSAYCVVENNSIGASVLKQLVVELEYENVFFSMAQLGDQTASQSVKAKTPGVKSSKRSKMQGCSKLKLMIENNQLIVEDFDCVAELSTFVLQKNGTYAAEEGYNDDTVATLWLFAWLTNQPVFKEITDLNLRQKLHAQRIKAMETQMPAAVEVISPKYREPPKIEKDKDGNLWVDASMSWDQAMELINDAGWVNNDRPEE